MGASKKNRNSRYFVQTRGGVGGWDLTVSKIFVEKIQTQICLGTVHKFDETHTLHKWGGNISSIHDVIEGGFPSPNLEPPTPRGEGGWPHGVQGCRSFPVHNTFLIQNLLQGSSDDL